MASLDLTTALQPIVYPPRGRPRSTVKHICIDPGHGGKQVGYLAGGEMEKKYTLLLAQELGAELRKAGYTVSYTRTTDTLIELGERPEIARRRNADLFVSLHFNSAGYTSPEVRGVEVYCMTPQRASSTNARGEGGNSGAFLGNLNNARNMVLAYELQKAITRGAGLEDRGVKRARFEVLRDAQMPAVLIEGGFMSNPAEARKIFSPAWRKQMAQAIASGISSYRRIVEP
jgi:N-acetylmuramoyl-L-alanine amidase